MGGIRHAEDGYWCGWHGFAVVRSLRAEYAVRPTILRASGTTRTTRSENPLGADGCGRSIHAAIRLHSPAGSGCFLLQDARGVLPVHGGGYAERRFLD